MGKSAILTVNCAYFYVIFEATYVTHSDRMKPYVKILKLIKKRECAEMPTCIKCKTYNNAGNVHCKQCKSILPVEGETHCPNCTSVNGPFAKVCKSCGLNLKMNNVVKLHGNRPTNSDKTAHSTNYTKLSTYKRKRFFDTLQKRAKMFFRPQSNVVTKVIVVLLVLLFVIGVIASF